MKTIGKLVTGMMFCTAFSLSGYGQQLLASNENPALPNTQEKQVTVKNSSERSIAIFAGPKEEIRDPRLRTYGGLSSNSVYVKPNDVVCLMSGEKKPIACTIIKPETTVVEVNSSATAVTGK